jgi:hypothetical protein
VSQRKHSALNCAGLNNTTSGGYPKIALSSRKPIREGTSDDGFLTNDGTAYASLGQVDVGGGGTIHAQVSMTSTALILI